MQMAAEVSDAVTSRLPVPGPDHSELETERGRI